VGSTASAESRANISQAVSGPDISGRNAYAFATGLPSASFVTDALTKHPTVGAAFQTPGATVLGTGAQGGRYSDDASALRTHLSEIAWQLDTTNLFGPLRVGLLDNKGFGSGFNTLDFEIDLQGLTVVDEAFTTLLAAQAFFDDRVLNLGAFSTSLPLDLVFRLEWTGDTAGTGFGITWLFGAGSTVVPPSPTVPLPNTLLLLSVGVVAFATLHRFLTPRWAHAPRR
jgi:hypothetical protein